MAELNIKLEPKKGRLDDVTVWVNGKKKVDRPFDEAIEERATVKKRPSKVKVRVFGGAEAVFHLEIQKRENKEDPWDKVVDKDLPLDEKGVFRDVFEA